MVKVVNTDKKQNGRIRSSKLIREKIIIKNSLINQNSKDTLENSINVNEDTLENSSNVQKDTLENSSNVQNINIIQEKDNSENLSQIDLTLWDNEMKM